MVDIHTVTIERPLITTYKSNLSVKSINFYCFVSMYVSLLFDGEYKSVGEEATKKHTRTQEQTYFMDISKQVTCHSCNIDGLFPFE